MKKVLIVGGGGFVGSHTTDALLQPGHSVKIFDNLSKQVHHDSFPSYLSHDAEFIEGDVRDLNALAKAVAGAEVIYHLATAIGIGQSMHRIYEYVHTRLQLAHDYIKEVLHHLTARGLVV